MIDRTQIHVVAAVAYGVVEYVRWTGDEEFMRDYGHEILEETARFWASRVDDTGTIAGVCGPDEACPAVDNNAYTNHLAAANLRWAARYRGPGITDDEMSLWLRTAERIRQQQPDERGVVEQFDGYHRTPELQRAKQADVLMLPVVSPGLLSPEQIAANFDYYEPRCAHGSSLSEGAYAVAAARAGMVDKAYELFRRCLFMDLKDLHGNTTNGGLHAACTGFVPTAIARGFCGLELSDERPVLDPRLPAPWRSVSFKVYYHGREIAVEC
jgi:trehalose/maltose hydrolase-like predicted phosphorylase